MTDFAAQIARIACTALAAEPDAAARVEAAIRRELGGQQVRIAERPPVTLAAIDEGLRARKPVAVIAQEMGVSRATLYRHLGRRAAKSHQGAAARQP